MILADINVPVKYPEAVTVAKAGTIATLLSLMANADSDLRFSKQLKSLFLQNIGTETIYWTFASSAPANNSAMFVLDPKLAITINVPRLWAQQIYVCVTAGATDGTLAVLQQS